MQKLSVNTTKNWVYLLLILLSFVLYGNTIWNDYGFDDVFVVSGNPYVQKGTAGIEEILDMPYAKIGNYTLDRRPIPLVTFALEHQFIGDNPHASHFINILIYSICLIILYKVLTEVLQLDNYFHLLPLIITVFFAVHPLHTEVVASLKNRDELFVLLFGLLYILYGYYYYTKTQKRWWYFLCCLLFLALTLLSKISGFIFVLLFIAICVFNNFFKGKKWNYLLIIFSIWLVIQAMIRVFENLNRLTTIFENPLVGTNNIFINLGTAFHILLYHLKMLILPSSLRFYYGANIFPLVSITNPLSFLSFILHLGLLIYAIIGFFKRDKLGLFILCYFISIALYSNFPVAYTSMFSERALLLSSLWFIIIISVVIVRAYNRYGVKLQNNLYKKVTVVCLTILFITYSYMTIQRNFLWKNTLTLMSHDIEYSENSILANYIYASNLKYASKIEKDKALSKELATKALYYYHQAIYLKPNYPEFYFKVASTYRYNLNNLDSAEVNFGYAISIDSLYGDANYELSKLFFDKQDFRKSYYFFGKTYAIQPKDSLTLFYYAQSASNVNDMETCYKINKEFLKLYPKLQYPYLNLGTYYSKILKDDSAVIYLDKAVELGARNPQLLQQLSVYYTNKKNTVKRDYYDKLLSN